MLITSVAIFSLFIFSSREKIRIRNKLLVCYIGMCFDSYGPFKSMFHSLEVVGRGRETLFNYTRRQIKNDQPGSHDFWRFLRQF